MFSMKHRPAAPLAAVVFGLCAAPLLLATPAQAGEGCRKVQIKVTNDHQDGVKVYDIKYYDYGSGKWRNEITKNRILGAGQSWTYRKRLEWVGGEKTLVQIKYRMADRGRWKIKRIANSRAKTCYRGSVYRIVLR